MMDGFAGRSLVIAATNFESALDPAIWRRFDDIVRFSKPTPDQITRLINLRLKPLQFNNDDVLQIAGTLIGAAFSDVERVCLDIRKACALAGTRRVDAEKVSDAIRRWGDRKRIIDGANPFGDPTVDRE
jgi:SpoVK/Ycf46/Vps4 family AAA+-type ATPase